MSSPSTVLPGPESPPSPNFSPVRSVRSVSTPERCTGAVTLAALDLGVPLDDPAAIAAAMADVDVDVIIDADGTNRVFLNDSDVSDRSAQPRYPRRCRRCRLSLKFV